MAVGYEHLGEPTSIVNGLTNLGRSIANRRDRDEAKQMKQQQLDQQAKRQQSADLTKGFDTLNKDYAFAKFATGNTELDKVIAPKLNEIRDKALDMMQQGNLQEGMLYAGMATQQLGTVHTLASNVMKNANTSIATLQKQDPNIDVGRLRSDLSKKIYSQFVNDDGTLADQNKLQELDIPDDLAGQLASTGNYYSSAAPATSFFADKKNMTPFEYANHNGLGGGQTIKGASSIYKPIEQDANGNYVPTTATEEVHIGDGHTAKVMPDDLYENLPMNVKGGITYSYNKMVIDPKSRLYTDETSPFFGLTPSDVQSQGKNAEEKDGVSHPLVEDLAKRWVARNLADQVSPSYVNRQQQANRIFASEVTGKGRGGGSGASTGDGSTDYYNTFEKITNTVGKDGGAVSVNQFSPSVQKYIGDILAASGSGLANNEAEIKWNKDQNRYELVDAEDGGLIAPLSEIETNLKTNSAAMKTRQSILKNTPEEENPKGLSEQDIKKGLKALGIGGRGGHKLDEQGRIDLRDIYN